MFVERTQKLSFFKRFRDQVTFCTFTHVSEQSWNLIRCAGDHPQGQWTTITLQVLDKYGACGHPILQGVRNVHKKSLDKGLKEHAHQRQWHIKEKKSDGHHLRRRPLHASLYLAAFGWS